MGLWGDRLHKTGGFLHKAGQHFGEALEHK
jgi:hypothetical protein